MKKLDHFKGIYLSETTFSKEYDDPAKMVLDIQNGGSYAVDDDSCTDAVFEAISDAIQSPSMTRYLVSVL